MFGRRNQQGAQRHAEGSHGDKTQSTAITYIHVPETGVEPARRGSAYGEIPSDGKHRLEEKREQHDAAERNSEVNRTESFGEAIARLKKEKR